MGKGRSGRPRASGVREPNGRLSRSNKPQVEPISGALWQRILQYGKQTAIDPRLCTELGRLNRFGELTAAQTVTGFRIAEIYGRYEGLKGLKRSVRSPSYNATFGDASIAEELLDPDRLKELEHRIRTATQNFEGLVGKTVWDGNRQIYVPGEIPPAMRATVEQLCVEDRCVSPVAYPDLRRLFDRLAQSWSGRAPRRSVVARGAAPAEAPAAAAAAARVPRVNAEREGFMAVMRKLRPDLSGEQLEEHFEFAQAIKARAIFRRSKREQQHKYLAHLSPVKESA